MAAALASPAAPLITLLAATCASALPAQTTWIVDQAGGTGAQFTSLSTAITAAADGDRILVRPGAYSEGPLDVDKGLAILGDPGAVVTANAFGSPGLTVRDLPAGSSFALRGLVFGAPFAAAPVLVADCAGLVLIEDVRGLTGQLGVPQHFGVHVEDSSQVHLHQLLVRGGQSIRFTRSVGAVTNCVLAGGVAGVAQTLDAEVTFERCTIDIEPTVSFAPPLQVLGGMVTLSRSTVAAPTSPQTPHPAIATQGAAVVRLDPTTTLLPSAGMPAVGGPATVVSGEVDTLSRAGAGVVTFDLHSRVGALFVAIATLPAATTPLPGFSMWIAPDPAEQLTIAAGVVLTRAQTFPFDTTTAPAGLRLVVQTGVMDPTLAVALSNGVAVVAD